ncbi:MAG: hypothetical protein ACTSSK_07830, partial [Candidatus Heimdallarchaeota archaeon]
YSILGGITINFEKVKAIVLEFIHQETGWGDPLIPHIEIEELTIMEMKEANDGSCSVSFEYMFNEDGFARSDKSHILCGSVMIGPTGKLIEKQLKETHRGISCEKNFQPKY